MLGGKRGGGRDIGLMLYGTLFESADGSFPVLSYNLGVFNGNGINTKDDKPGHLLQTMLTVKF